MVIMNISAVLMSGGMRCILVTNVNVAREEK